MILAPLFLLASSGGWKRSLARLAPHLALAALAVASVMATRGESFRFTDGSFSLHAPVWATWPYGVARVLGIWGAAALAALVWRRAFGRQALQALAWIGIALIPYSFLTYSRQIPSRQTYLASFGLALLAGLALAQLRAAENGAGKLRRWTAMAAAVMVLGNVWYLWTKKREQFLERAEPTEQLIRLARETDGPIWVQCFPRVDYIAREAVHLVCGETTVNPDLGSKRRNGARR